MLKVGEFYKVSFEEFKKTYQKIIDKNNNQSIDEIKKIYNNIKLPRRVTNGSAGYDFYSPIDFTLESKMEITIPFGIRVKIDDGFLLQLFPRSGLGSNYRLQLNNTTGIIDSDYFYAKNEGHIMSRIANCSFENKTLNIRKGDAILQGVFLQYGITYDDEKYPKSDRIGGFGSTDNRSINE